ncbi:hypothetical protein PR048_013115 [Dryococelus australis]|uniref:HTH psq-type domain-containing protein n=1 Tax=Dryococelus australis TaxID=614101 RepID=A0ABQ9HR94_9NEOP|nr:hypothetical protein PR048_013115 [Dryococelus australis]
MSNKGKKLGTSWNQDQLIAAMDVVLKDGMSIRGAVVKYGIPRTTLRHHLASGSPTKIKAKNYTFVQEYSDLLISMPVTPKVMKRTIFTFCEVNQLGHLFNKTAGLPGRNCNDRIECALETALYLQYEQKGNSSLPSQTKKGAKRVHNIASEHDENITIVACGNALENVISPVILLKGDRMKPDWKENLPPGRHALLFDEAQSHLDANIVTAVEAHGVTLFCLPSNTTNELQPLDKSVFKQFESYWGDEVMWFWARKSSGKVVHKCEKILPQDGTGLSGFEATSVYPYNPNRIPDEAYAPSDLKQQTRIEVQSDRASADKSLRTP